MRETETMIHWDGAEAEGWRSDEEVAEYIRNARSWTFGTHRRKARDSD